MAAQKSEKSKSQSGKGGIMGLVSKVLAVAAITLGAIFFAAMFDVGHAGLIHTLAGSAIVLVPLFAISALAALFAAPKAGSDVDELAAQVQALSETKTKMTSQILALQNQLDSMNGQDIEALRAKNKELQDELDAIHEAEREKMGVEVDSLRKRNEELEAQIKKWALDTVAKNVGDKAAAKAA